MTTRPLRIGLIGDQSPDVRAHTAIPQALTHTAHALECPVTWRWLATDALASAADSPDDCDGLWCVPGSPYRSMAGALAAIRFARARDVPFLGTCGGFQHAVIEFARHVAGIGDAEHAESSPDADRPIITPLACSLVGVSGDIVFRRGSRVASMYGALHAREQYHCSYGLDPAYRDRIDACGLRITGRDPEGSVRVVELWAHPFYVATLFQPELSSTTEHPAPVVMGFVRAVASARRA